ncbi:MAG TPA: ATP-binding protein [Patescibacteria group bacterium]|nr:ATP-binding protein [Patescibacteria group bacterium]
MLAAFALIASWLASQGAADVPVTLQSSGSGYVIGSVSPGSLPWSVGLRPGQPVLAMAPPGGGPSDWNTLFVSGSDGQTLTVSRGGLAAPAGMAFLAGVGLLLVALPLWRWTSASGVALVASSILAGSAQYALVARPLALALWLVPVMVATLALLVPPVRRGWIIALVAPAALVGVWSVATVAPLEDWAPLFALGPAAGGVLAALGVGLAVRSGWHRARVRQVRMAALGVATPFRVVLVDELVPGRAAAESTAAREERSRLASELHSEVLPLVGHMASLARGGFPDHAAGELEELEGTLRSLMNERRNIELETVGLVAAVETLVESAVAPGSPEVMIDVIADEGTPPPLVAEAVYDAIREAMENVLRHAHATRVSIEIDTAPDHVRVAVSDDGAGIDPRAAADARRRGHLGLAGMETAAALVGASVQVGPEPGGGTRLSWRWPTP